VRFKQNEKYRAGIPGDVDEECGYSQDEDLRAKADVVLKIKVQY
jgi:hypothetical protein